VYFEERVNLKRSPGEPAPGQFIKSKGLQIETVTPVRYESLLWNNTPNCNTRVLVKPVSEWRKERSDVETIPLNYFDLQ
jgi:hypothetical protein